MQYCQCVLRGSAHNNNNNNNNNNVNMNANENRRLPLRATMAAATAAGNTTTETLEEFLSQPRYNSNNKNNNNKEVIVTMANFAYRSFLGPWYNNLKRLKLEERALIAAGDLELMSYCKEQSLPCFFYSKVLLPTVDTKYDEPILGLFKASLLLDILSAGFDFLFSELDILLVNSPFDCSRYPGGWTYSEAKCQPFIESSAHLNKVNESQTADDKGFQPECIDRSSDFDLHIQVNTISWQRPSREDEVNIGFYYMKANANAFALLNHTLSKLRDSTERVWDQLLMSKLIWDAPQLFAQYDSLKLSASDSCILSSPDVNRSAPSTLKVHLLDALHFPTSFFTLKDRWYNEIGHGRGCFAPTAIHCTGIVGAPIFAGHGPMVTKKQNCMDQVAYMYQVDYGF